MRYGNARWLVPTGLALVILLLVAVWRRESPEHQRTVGVLSIGLAVVTLVTCMPPIVAGAVKAAL